MSFNCMGWLEPHGELCNKHIAHSEATLSYCHGGIIFCSEKCMLSYQELHRFCCVTDLPSLRECLVPEELQIMAELSE